MASIDSYRTPTGQLRYRARIRREGSSLVQVFTTKADAKRWAQIQEGSLLARETKLTLGEAFARYTRDILPLKKPSTQRSQKFHMQHVLQLLGPSTPLTDITPAQLRTLCNHLQRDGYAPATAVRYLALISHLFTTAIREWELAEQNPVSRLRKPREPRGRTRFLSDEERRNLLEACKASRNPHLYIIVILALSTGARHGELLGLRWSDVDLQRGILTFQNTKNNDRRSVPLTGHGLGLLQAREQCSGFVFPDTKGKKPTSIRTAWEAAVARAGLSDFRFHDLRHSAASYLAMNGASLLDIAEILGHKSLSMVQRYSHLSEGHKRSVVERMNQVIFP